VPEGNASYPGGCGKVFFLLSKDLVSEESLLGHISKYLTILENGAWMVGRSGVWGDGRTGLGRADGTYLGSSLRPYVRGGGVFIFRTCHVFNHCDFFIPFS